MGKNKYPRIPMSNNMIAQILSAFDHTNEGHYSTKARYLSATAPLVEFLVKDFHSQKFPKLSGKHLCAYVKKRQADGIAPATIMSDLSAIRYAYRLVGGKNRLPDNAELGLEKRKVGEMDRAWLPDEIDKAIALAKAMGRTDLAFAIRLSKEFGLRVSEVARIRLEHIEKALDNDHLWVKGKGGQVREVPVERPEQRELLNDLKAYSTKKGLQGMELVLSDNKKYGVERKIDSLQNWVINHRSKFTEVDRTNDVKEGYKPKVDKITLNGLRHYYTQKITFATQNATLAKAWGIIGNQSPRFIRTRNSRGEPMPRRKRIPRNKLGIPEYQMESLARALLPIVQEYLASDQGKQDYAEWKANKDKKTNIEYENNSINEING